MINRTFSVPLFLLFAACLGLSACATTKPSNASAEESAQVSQAKDPWEPFNRVVYSANMTVDRWLIKPVAKGYKFVTPEPVEQGVSNFFDNIGEVPNTLNSVLQWKWGNAGNSSGRFLVNSTVGVVGLFDVAKHAGLAKHDKESFGQTLSVWGVGAGPYIVLPLLGPSTVTDTIALPVDWYSDPVTYIDDESTRYSLRALELVDLRASLLDAEKLISGDRYTFVREAYMQRRDYLVNDGVVKDDFGDDLGNTDEEF